MTLELNFNSPESIRDVIGFLHHNISQHTKEIAVINTTLADLNKNKFNFEYKEEFDDFASETNRKLERMSMSLKLLTKQTFNTDMNLQKITEQIGKEPSENNKNMESIIMDINELKNKQNEILIRLEKLENLQKECSQQTNQQQQKKQVRFATLKNTVVYDSKPLNEQFKGIEDPQNMAQVLDFVKKQIDELSLLRSVQEENNKRFGKFIQVSQDSLNNFNDQIKRLNNKTETEYNDLRKELDKFCNKEDLQNILLQASTLKSPNAGKYGRGKRPITSSVVTRSNPNVDQQFNQDYILPSVSVTMINGESLTRPSTVQAGRFSISQKTPHLKYRK